MMAAKRFLVALVSATFAFADTSLVAWSSSGSTALDALPPSLTTSKFTNHILNNDQLCDFDAIVLIDQPGDHRNGLSSHVISRSISSAPSARSFKLSGSFNLPVTAESLSSRCNARFLSYTPGPSSSGDVSLEEGQKHVLCLKMPENADIEKHEASLAAELSTISSIFPSHFIIYTGPGLSNLHIRQSPETPPRPTIETTTNTSQIPVNNPAASITDVNTTVYFTTGLITALLLVFFILLPVLFIGVGALASIQTPIRMDAPKGYSAVERKNQ
ncbi:hypothetical protein AGABI1DRAFT_116216 [Agaricus bisporus var. burnettii JB137-S8]|uniref:V-type proton ATPase subunit S1/VOA1 transmembrane domain-containing protein n=1 Tax=Agaricus bisporus var. burnettii (strain JB137-S8 / ATCC MYA-4627 / FGSC 10392) TaxID=597362 RepID=K5VMT0_AGABU|nr:uncharacterized protein AGABI1DRAFT_116216 [Agaricus bisporus var. burnettii JB137-S8]EKM75749.1 hypothetical protein AGABI1DRAFT_116216 [Agaricus bisporus var. burnettii JB137-S8]